jgi:hypothetical protein
VTRQHARAALAASLTALLFLPAAPAHAWVYPEHRNIAGSALSGLSPERKATLERLWAEARKGHEDRLCESPWAGDQGKKPGCIDLAAFPAIAGDHSCSADQMLKTVLETKWILEVAAVTAVLDHGIAKAKNGYEVRNRLTWAELELQRKDPAYVTRASSNASHFLLVRETDDVHDYLVSSLHEGAAMNGLGVWGRYHLAAMRLAAELEAGRVPPELRSEVARTALAAEAYGDHFLEDAFAAGHVAGTWGDVATRLGTHNYYNESGLDAVAWNGKPMLLHGDANMRPADLARTAAAVRESFERVLDAAAPGSALAAEFAAIPLDWAKAVLTLGTCTNDPLPGAPAIPKPVLASSAEILAETARPSRKPPDAALPRFRAEIGPFVGLAAGLAGGAADGGFESTDSPGRATGTMDINARVGVGLEAVLGEAGDGQIFLQVGVLQEIGQKDACAEPCSAAGLVTSLALRTPARRAITTRLRLPFWLIPGDLIVAAPFLVPFAPKTYEKMAMVAASGGVLPWQAGISTFLGRVQFVAGREIGVSFFGYSGGEDQLFVSTPGATAPLTVISLRTIRFDVPLVEIRPFRGFATNQAAAVLLQIGLGFDKPTKITVVAPAGGPEPDLKTAKSVYLRLAFDWRHYF